jgi:hypothetical protein
VQQLLVNTDLEPPVVNVVDMASASSYGSLTGFSWETVPPEGIAAAVRPDGTIDYDALAATTGPSFHAFSFAATLLAMALGSNPLLPSTAEVYEEVLFAGPACDGDVLSPKERLIIAKARTGLAAFEDHPLWPMLPAAAQEFFRMGLQPDPLRRATLGQLRDSIWGREMFGGALAAAAPPPLAAAPAAVLVVEPLAAPLAAAAAADVGSKPDHVAASPPAVSGAAVAACVPAPAPAVTQPLEVLRLRAEVAAQRARADAAEAALLQSAAERQREAERADAERRRADSAEGALQEACARERGLECQLVALRAEAASWEEERAQLVARLACFEAEEGAAADCSAECEDAPTASQLLCMGSVSSSVDSGGAGASKSVSARAVAASRQTQDDVAGEGARLGLGCSSTPVSAAAVVGNSIGGAAAPCIGSFKPAAANAVRADPSSSCMHTASRSSDAGTGDADKGSRSQVPVVAAANAAGLATSGSASNSCTTTSNSSPRATPAAALHSYVTATVTVVGRHKGPAAPPAKSVSAKRVKGEPDARTPAQRLQGALHKLNKERRKVAAAFKGLLSAA